MAKQKIKARIMQEKIVTESNEDTNELYDKSRFGVKLENNKLQLSLIEGFYLLEKNKIDIVDSRSKSIDREKLIKKFIKIEPNFLPRYLVFKDMRDRGYIIKTALKFGAEFRVYDRGIKPGEDHAKWIVYPVSEGQILTWHDFSAKNRVAHSTKKRLLIGVVDEENDVTYYEIKWVRP